MFDPYHKWLGIPKDQRPPTYYQLLGLAPGESDVEVIEEAAIRQTSHLRAYQIGPHADLCTRLLNEIAQARATLRDAVKRQQYDRKIAPPPTTAVTAKPAAPAGSPFDDLGQERDDRPKLVNFQNPARSQAGLWIGAAAALCVVAGIVVAIVMSRDQTAPIANPDPPPPVVPIKGKEPPPPIGPQTRAQLLAAAPAHWLFGADAKNPKQPLLPVGTIETGAVAEGPGARPGAKVARLDNGYYDAGREFNPDGDGLTVYLRARDAAGRWDYGLLSKRGNAAQVAFHLFSGDVAPTPGPDIGFEVRTDTGLARVSFPVSAIDARAWHDLVGRYDGRKLQIICDGKVLAEQPLTGALQRNQEAVLIGAESVQGRAVRPFTGELEEAALWSRALTDDEIATLSATEKLLIALVPPPPPPPPVRAEGLVEVKAGEIYRTGAFAMFITITPDGRHAIFQQARGLSIWGVEENRELRVLPLVNITAKSAVVTPDSQTLAVALAQNKVLLFDLATGNLQREIIHGPNLYSLAFSADGATLLTGGGLGFKKDNVIKLWDLSNGALVRTLEGHELPVLNVAMNADHVLSTDGSRKLQRWDAKDGKPLDMRVLELLGPHLDFAPGARRAAFLKPNRLVVWDFADDKEVAAVNLGPAFRAATVFDVTPDARLGVVATRDTHELYVYDLAKGTPVKTLTGHGSPLRAVALTPDGRRAYSLDNNRMLHIWKLDDIAVTQAKAEVKPETKPEPKVQAKLDPKFIPEWETIKCPSFCAIAITPDGRRAVTAGPGVDVWDLVAGKHLRNLLPPRGSISGAVALSPDGTQAFGVGGEPTLRIWDIESGTVLRSYDYPPDRRVLGVAWSPSGQYVAAGSSPFLDIFDAETLKPKGGVGNSSEFGHVHAVAFYRDSVNVIFGMENGQIRSHPVAGGKTLDLFRHAPATAIHQLATLKDMVVSVGVDKTLRVWDTFPKLREVSRSDTKTNSRAVAVAPNAAYAVTGGDDQKIRFWYLSSNRIIHSYQADGTVRGLAFAPSGRYFLSTSDDGLLRSWRLPKEIAKE